MKARSASVNLNVKKLHSSLVDKLLSKPGRLFVEANEPYHDPGHTQQPINKIGRKEQRRLQKELRKAKNIARNRKLPIGEVASASLRKILPASNKSRNKSKVSNKSEKQRLEDDNAVSARNREMHKHNKEIERTRRKQQRRLVKDEQHVIDLYERKLGLKKKSGKSILKQFAEDGFSELLDFCNQVETGKLNAQEGEVSDAESENLDENFSDDENTVDKPGDDDDNPPKAESDSGNEEPEELPSGKGRRRNNKTVTFAASLLEKEYSDSEKIEQDSIVREDSENDNYDFEMGDQSDEEENNSNSEFDEKEERNFNVLAKSETVNMERARPVLDSGDVSDSLRKQVKGIVNRLSEKNMAVMIQSCSSLLETFSRNEVKTALTEAILNACLQNDKLPSRLLLEHCGLLATLHNVVSSDLTAFFLEHLAQKFWALFSETEKPLSVDNKQPENALLIFAHLFNLRVTSSAIVTELLKKLIESFNERNIDLLLSLRKENPLAVKGIIQEINAKCDSPEAVALKSSARVRFMLESLSALKNNNLDKLSSAADREIIEHFQRQLKSWTKGRTEVPWEMTFDELTQAPEKGRWWVVGSAAATPSASSASLGMPKNKAKANLKFDRELLELAKKQRMNTGTRRNIFCVIMSAEDYMDAFVKLLKLGIKGSPEREIIHICVDCGLQEEKFNPYYGALILQFCQHHKRFPITAQFALWDKLKLISTLDKIQRRNLANLLVFLIKNKALGLGVLKILELGTLTKKQSSFLEYLFGQLFQQISQDEEFDALFSQTFSDQKNKSFCLGLHYFFTQTLQRSATAQSNAILQRRIVFAVGLMEQFSLAA